MLLSLPLSLAALTVSVGVSAETLKSNLIQSASASTGQAGAQAKEGQVLSDTSKNNFINVCEGKLLTNGKQNAEGSCNGIPMGEIPSKKNMVSTVILFPETGKTVTAGQTFDIKVKVANLNTGSFTNPLATFYAAPQKLAGGRIVGHTHVTVQNLGNTFNPQTPLNAETFAFFKGIQTKADADGVLKATVTGGLPVGKYRVCTLSSAANHQAVLMPVAQRGSQDDCTKFEVVGGGSGGEKDKKKESNNAKSNVKAGEIKSSNNSGGEKAKSDDDDDDKDKDKAKASTKVDDSTEKDKDKDKEKEKEREKQSKTEKSSIATSGVSRDEDKKEKSAKSTKRGGDVGDVGEDCQNPNKPDTAKTESTVEVTKPALIATKKADKQKQEPEVTVEECGKLSDAASSKSNTMDKEGKKQEI